MSDLLAVLAEASALAAGWPVERGDWDRSVAAVHVHELLRVDVPEVTAIEFVRMWNQRNDPPASQDVLMHVVQDSILTPPKAVPKPSQVETRGTRPAKVELVVNPLAPRWKAVPISSLDDALEDVPWLWQGFIAKGNITLLQGHPKGGKTTLFGFLLHALEEGTDLFTPSVACKTLIVTEEGYHLWYRRREQHGLTKPDLISRPFQTKPSWQDWDQFTTWLASEVEDNGYDLVVFDTLAGVSPLVDENDAMQMQDICRPLHRVTNRGAAVLIVHHCGKSARGHGMGGRGSNALPGFVDIIAELRPFKGESEKDNRRRLLAWSRYEESPAELVIELTEAGHYDLIEGEVARRSDRRCNQFDAILGALAASVAPQTIGMIQVVWPDPALNHEIRSLRKALDVLETQGKIVRSGTGVKGDPLRWGLKTTIAAPPR